jgi:cell division septation protein DedD
MQHRRPLRMADLCFAILAVMLSCGVAVAQDNRDPAELLEDGRRAFEREDFAQARTDLWAYLDATAGLTGASRLPQAEALYYIALMEPDASVAARHYQIIADEFPAASVADEALFRLAVLELVQGRSVEAREWFAEVRQNYPYSETQPEIPLWIGRTYLAEGEPLQATEQFLAGFTGVKSGDLPHDLPLAQREALAAEYAWWLATAYHEAGDERTATQYYSLLTLDYPNSPQAAEARVALGTEGAGGEVAVAGPPVEEAPPVDTAEEPVREPIMEPAPEPVREEPAPEPVREEPAPEPVREEPREAPVVVQPIRPVPAAEERLPARERPDTDEGLVYLQVGAFTSATRAADLSKRLTDDDFTSTVKVAVVDGRGFYRVRVGPFRLPADADRAAATRQRLSARGYPVEQVAAAP